MFFEVASQLKIGLMARSVAKTVLVPFLKVLNSIMGVVGIAMILYGLWMVRVWLRDLEGTSLDEHHSTFPWFICTFFGVGITFCSVACLGHISADISTGFCLSCYTVVIFVLLLLETAAAADILLNSNWEEDLPEDRTGKFHDFEEFVESNSDVFKWISLVIFLAQGSCALLVMTIGAVDQEDDESNYGSDEEYCPGRFPLLDHHNCSQPTYVVVDPPKLIHVV